MQAVAVCGMHKWFVGFSSSSVWRAACTRTMSSGSAGTDSLPISIDDVYAAYERIRHDVHQTPVHTSSFLNRLSGYNLHFKCENFQKTGSFKIRGALNAVRHCSLEDPVIVTHSSGNHAQAVAMAASLTGYKAHVVMPKASLKVKKQAVLDLGAEVSMCENYEQSRQEVADKVMAAIGPRALFLSPVNHPDIMAGQGTIALELLQQVPELDAIVVSVGGGGMISGISVAAKAIKPGIKVIAAEPLAANDCANSLKAGKIIPNPGPPDTICDALLTTIKELPWQVIKEKVDGVVTVTDEEVVAAMKYIMERMKLVIEPSAACPLAAVLKEDFKSVAGSQGIKNIGIIICGGNVDLTTIHEYYK